MQDLKYNMYMWLEPVYTMTNDHGHRFLISFISWEMSGSPILLFIMSLEIKLTTSEYIKKNEWESDMKSYMLINEYSLGGYPNFVVRKPR